MATVFYDLVNVYIFTYFAFNIIHAQTDYIFKSLYISLMLYLWTYLFFVKTFFYYYVLLFVNAHYILYVCLWFLQIAPDVRSQAIR